MEKKFCIISNNCWGGEVYKLYDQPFNTPFIGLFFFPDCYIKLLSNFRSNLLLPLSFTKSSRYLQTAVKYPIGLLGGEMEIHFMHFKTEEEAKEKWERRVRRVPETEADLFLKFDDRDGCRKEHLEAFHKLPFNNKLSFTCQAYPALPDNIHIHTRSGELPDAVVLFRKSEKYFSLKAWLDGKGIKLTVYGKLCKVVDQLQRSLSQREQMIANNGLQQ